LTCGLFFSNKIKIWGYLIMAVFRIEKSKNYTVMSNYHLNDKNLTLKAKGLLSQMLSLPESWDYTLKGLSLINKESVDAIRTAIWELEKQGYISRQQGRDANGKLTAIEYTIYEHPQVVASPLLENPITVEKQDPTAPLLDFPTTDNPTSEKPISENPTQLNTNIINTNIPSTYSSSSRVGNQAARAGEDEDLQALRKKIQDKVVQLGLSDPLRKIIQHNFGEGELAEFEQLNEFICTLREGASQRPPTTHLPQERYRHVLKLIERAFGAYAPSVRLGGTIMPPEEVQRRLLEVTPAHIWHVIRHVQQCGTHIANVESYYLSCLMRAPDTMELADLSQEDWEEQQESGSC